MSRLNEVKELTNCEITEESHQRPHARLNYCFSKLLAHVIYEINQHVIIRLLLMIFSLSKYFHRKRREIISPFALAYCRICFVWHRKKSFHSVTFEIFSNINNFLPI